MKNIDIRTKTMSVKNNKLYVGNFSMHELKDKFKTPLYVYDEVHLRNKLDVFKNYFKSNRYECKVVYASKAFYCPYLANIIKEYHFGMDSISLGDLYMFKHANFPFCDVVLHGNNKTIEEIKFAIMNGVGVYVVDNLEEMKNLISITDELNVKVNVLLRVNPGIEAHTHEYIQTSLLSSKFGESIYEEDKIKYIVEIAKNSKYINFLGFHCHIGSSINEEKSFEDATLVMLNFMYKMQNICNYEFNTLNLGGGFGIKYVNDDKEINLKAMLKIITTTVNNYLDRNNLNLKRLMIEPGRSIVGDSGFTLYTAGITKYTYGKKNYLFLDGGMTDNIRPALYDASYSIDNADNIEGRCIKVDCVGPCCESGDIVAKDVLVQEANVGDAIVSYCTGAYGYSMSSNYNGFVKGSVIFVNNDKINVGIKRQEVNDLMSNFPKQKDFRIFDCHSDMLFDLWQKKIKGVKDEFIDYHVNQLETSQIHGAIWTMYSEWDFDLLEAIKIALNEIKMEKLTDFNVILGLEGLRNLKQIEDLDTLHQMGFRHAMVTWNEANKYATGAKSDPNRGFTEEGIKLLKHMQELGWIIDLGHTNEKSFYDALRVVRKNVIFSHGLCKALCNHPRNLTDDQMRALKEVDGLFGLTLASSFIDENKDNRTMARFLEHVKHAISIMTIDNVCFGFDFMDYLDAFANSNLSDVSDATMTNNIIIGLKSIGLSDDDIDKITWKNFYSRYKDLVVMKGKKNE